MIPPHQVTAASLYAEIIALRTEVGHLLTRVEVADARGKAANDSAIDHEQRLRAIERQVPDDLERRLIEVERWQWRTTGMVMLAAFVCSLIGAYVAYLAGAIR